MTKFNYYPLEKFTQAVYSLATGEGDARSRVLDAYMAFHPVNDTDLPEELQPDYQWVMAKLTSREPIYNHRGEVYKGSVEHSLEKMRNKTAAEIARRIVKIHDELQIMANEINK